MKISNNPAKYEALIKQYLRPILDISKATFSGYDLAFEHTLSGHEWSEEKAGRKRREEKGGGRDKGRVCKQKFKGAVH